MIGIGHFLYTDAARIGGMGYILIQEEELSEKKFLIATGSTRLSKAQRGYSTTELELAAIVWAVKKTRHWLKGAPQVTLCTDHSSRQTLDDVEKETILGQLEKLGGYNLDFYYVPQKLNRITDGLRRFPADEPEEEEEE